MVLLASAVISKQNGKILLSRQFVEMSRSRIEGVLTAFSKLIIKDKQHTFIETDTVRYVYQALMDKLYCVLITTKTSNILEDLETLRLFVRVINEYTISGKNVSDEQAILDNAFTLLFAFDEIVALGYRENVNMSQVRTFIEMDSHEERVFEAVRKTQERDAKQKMREKAKELSKIQRTQQIERIRTGIGGSGTGYSGISSSNGSSSYDNNKSSNISSSRNISSSINQSSSSLSKPRGPSKALKLGSKNQNIFAPPPEEQLQTELKQEAKIGSPISQSNNELVHITIEERLNLELSRDGAPQHSELTGVVLILIQDEQYSKVKFLVDCDDAEHVQIQSHPNVDKELFRQQGLITLRQKSFPVNSSVGVLKYRRISPSGRDWPPLTLNCWPNGNNCNLELVANRPLTEVSISIPCPTQPTVNECTDGDYTYKRGFLVWNISVISPDANSVTIDFDLPASSGASNDDFFPIGCSFNSEYNLAGLIIKEVLDDEIEDVKWSLESKLNVDKYEVV
ncbi:hypothetical protein RDWZM_005213 [Blomia tropicalis]|uniref:Coatomer subunit delta n=1 Tax=Blomia tropicalis TaxID=40697 RepID=A0A9Q0RN98_BLOTA|nr:hypothetical protein RDWZM_005213 [Blomia tropicalis]